MKGQNKDTHFNCNKVQPFSFLAQIYAVKSNEPVRRWDYLDSDGNLETIICYKRHSLVTTCHVIINDIKFTLSYTSEIIIFLYCLISILFGLYFELNLKGRFVSLQTNSLNIEINKVIEMH